MLAVTLTTQLVLMSVVCCLQTNLKAAIKWRAKKWVSGFYDFRVIEAINAAAEKVRISYGTWPSIHLLVVLCT